MDPCTLAWPLELGIRTPTLLVWPLEFGLWTHMLLACPLELMTLLAWPFELEIRSPPRLCVALGVEDMDYHAFAPAP